MCDALALGDWAAAESFLKSDERPSLAIERAATCRRVVDSLLEVLTSPDAAMSGLRLIEEASRMGREVTGLLLVDESQPTLDENLGVSAERPPALADISLASNQEGNQALLADLR